MRTVRYLTVHSAGDVRLSDEAPDIKSGGVTFRLIINTPQIWEEVIGDRTLDAPGIAPTLTVRK